MALIDELKNAQKDAKTDENKRFKKYQDNPEYAAMVQHMDENVQQWYRRIGYGNVDSVYCYTILLRKSI